MRGTMLRLLAIVVLLSVVAGLGIGWNGVLHFDRVFEFRADLWIPMCLLTGLRLRLRKYVR